MRFERLRIPAFGPFTKVTFHFPAGPGDFQVIYGENEAGKSSLLRAIRDLLFGMHGQCQDNFLHDYKDLRIEGEIANRAGEKLIFQRRKGNRNTLLEADGNPLPDTALLPFLGSVDPAYFSAMFGLGARELREGATELLSGQGEIGQALFSASLGGTPVQKVLAALRAEAEGLFKGRATANVSIRPAANRHKELVRLGREAVVTAETWEQLEQGLEAAEATRSRLEAEAADISRQWEWIARCEDALPTVGRLSEQDRQLGGLPPLPEVSRDFVERARATRQRFAEAQAEVKRLTFQMAALRMQLAGCATAPAILEEATVIERLHQELGSYRDRQKAVADREARLAGREPALRAGLQNFGLPGEFTSLESLRLSSPVRLACEESARELQEALRQQEECVTKAAEVARQVEELGKQLAALPETDLNPLRDALATAAGATEAARTVQAAEAEVHRLASEVAERHRDLVGAPADYSAAASLAVPSKATIRRFREDMEAIRRDIQAEEGKTLEGRKRIENIQAELGRMERRGELPTAEALRAARQERDRGWHLVLADWKGDGATEELVPGTPLEEAFPEAIVRADGIADALWRQAEAVAQAEEKRFQMGKSEKQNQEAQTRIAELQAALEKCQDSWIEAWKPCGLAPATPDEMEEWRESWTVFREALGRLQSAEAACRQKQEQVRQANQQLAAVLEEADTRGFALLFDAAKRRVQAGEQAAGRREQVVEQLEGLQRQLGMLEQNRGRLAEAVAGTERKWAAQCQAVGFPSDTSPQAGVVLLQERKELLATFDSWRELSAERATLSRQVREYEAAVRDQAAALGVAGDTVEAQEGALWKALVAARTSQTRHDQLAVQIQSVTDELEAAQPAANRASEELAEVVRLAQLTSAEGLEPLLANLELREETQAKIGELRDTLSGLARGQALDEFIPRVLAEDATTFAERKRRLEQDQQERQARLQEARDARSELKKRKQELEKAGDAAADYRQQAESWAATLREDAARFIRLRLATHLLEAQIERFRRDNQGPLLERSGRVFRQITREAFSGLDAEFSSDDLPVLVGRRPNGTTVAIEAMSDGTRDQLYLALRLAALDRYLEAHEPMPLILDDLLITFDDERAKAILPELAALAQRTQVFLFTHHQHLVELCRQTMGQDRFHLHRLDSPAARVA